MDIYRVCIADHREYVIKAVMQPPDIHIVIGSPECQFLSILLPQLGICIPFTSTSKAVMPIMTNQRSLDDQHPAWQMKEQMYKPPSYPVAAVSQREIGRASGTTETCEAILYMGGRKN